MFKLRILCVAVILSAVIMGMIAIPSKAVTNYQTITLELESTDDNALVWYDSANWDFMTGDGLKAVQAGFHSVPYQRMQSGFRYCDVPIEYGADIRSAYLTFTAYDNINTGRYVNTVIRYEENPYPYEFSDYDDFAERDWSSRKVEWEDIPAWTAGKSYKSPDISSLIEDIVEDGDWDYGNDLVLFWGDEDGDSTIKNGTCRRAFSATSSNAVTLTITFDAGTSSSYYYDSDDMEDVLESIDGRLSNLSNTYSIVTTDLNTLKSQLSSALAEVQALRSSSGTDRMDEMVSLSNSLATQLAQLQKEFQEYQDNNAELKTMIQATAGKVDEVQSGVYESVDAVEGYVGEAEAVTKSVNTVRMLVILCLLLVGVNLTVLYLIYRRGK